MKKKEQDKNLIELIMERFNITIKQIAKETGYHKSYIGKCKAGVMDFTIQLIDKLYDVYPFFLSCSEGNFGFEIGTELECLKRAIDVDVFPSVIEHGKYKYNMPSRKFAIQRISQLTEIPLHLLKQVHGNSDFYKLLEEATA